MDFNGGRDHESSTDDHSIHLLKEWTRGSTRAPFLTQPDLGLFPVTTAA